MRTIILSIGDELILGQIADTNAAWLSAQLVEQGVKPLYHQAVPDDLDTISEAVKEAVEQAELVIISGGLGPTPDDLTRQAIAAAAGVKLVLHSPSLKKLEMFFKERGRTMSQNNRIQAMFPKGATVLANPIGTAPGFSIVLGKVKHPAARVSAEPTGKAGSRGASLRNPAKPGTPMFPVATCPQCYAQHCRRGHRALWRRRAKIVVMPGVPKEMKLMFEKHIAPMLKAGQKSEIFTQKLNVFGLGESVVAEKLGKLMRRGRNPLVGTTVSGGVVSIRIRGEFAGGKNGAREPALPEMRATADEIKRLLGNTVFSEGDVSLAEIVGQMLVMVRKTVVIAESCTGGLLAAMLTEPPGASEYFSGGWVVYSNRMKTETLAVPDKLIRKEGAVSEAVARRMAEGALIMSKADYALALTGIAGPGGGSSQKPIGTVWIALAQKTAGGADVHAEKFLFPGDRALVRERAAKTALNILRLHLLQTDRYILPRRSQKKKVKK